MLKKYNPEGFPANPAYSHAAEATGTNRMLFIAGQVGIGPDGTIPPGVGEQAELAIASLRAVLASADMTIEDIAKYTIYLTDAALMPEFQAAAGKHLPDPPPPATLLIVKGLAMPELKVEIEAIAVR